VKLSARQLRNGRAVGDRNRLGTRANKTRKMKYPGTVPADAETNRL
jgi:hypothetical protein